MREPRSARNDIERLKSLRSRGTKKKKKCFQVERSEERPRGPRNDASRRPVCPSWYDVDAHHRFSSPGFDPSSSSSEGQLHRAPSGVEYVATHASRQRFSKCPSGISSAPHSRLRQQQPPPPSPPYTPYPPRSAGSERGSPFRRRRRRLFQLFFVARCSFVLVALFTWLFEENEREKTAVTMPNWHADLVSRICGMCRLPLLSFFSPSRTTIERYDFWDGPVSIHGDRRIESCREILRLGIRNVAAQLQNSVFLFFWIGCEEPSFFFFFFSLCNSSLLYVEWAIWVYYYTSFAETSGIFKDTVICKIWDLAYLLSKEQSFRVILNLVYLVQLYSFRYYVYSGSRKNISFVKILKIFVSRCHFPRDRVDRFLQVPFIVARCRSFAAHVFPFVSQIDRTRLLRRETEKGSHSLLRFAPSHFETSSVENFNVVNLMSWSYVSLYAIHIRFSIRRIISK